MISHSWGIDLLREERSLLTKRSVFLFRDQEITGEGVCFLLFPGGGLLFTIDEDRLLPVEKDIHGLGE